MSALTDEEALALGTEMEFCTRAVMIAADEGTKLIEHKDERVGAMASLLVACRDVAHKRGLEVIKQKAPQLSGDVQAVLAWGPAYELVRDILRENQHAPGFFSGRKVRAEAHRIIDMLEVIRRQYSREVEALAPELLAENRAKRNQVI